MYDCPCLGHKKVCNYNGRYSVEVQVQSLLQDNTKILIGQRSRITLAWKTAEWRNPAQQLPQVMSPKNLIEDYSGDPYQLYGVQKKIWRRWSPSSYRWRSGGSWKDRPAVRHPIADAIWQLSGKHCRFWSWRWRVTKNADFTRIRAEHMRLSQARALEWCKVQHSCTMVTSTPSWQACPRRCHPRVLAGRLASTVSRSSRRRIRLGTVFAVIGTPRSLHARMSAILTLLAHDATKEGVCVSPAVTLLFQCEPRPGTLSFHGNHVPTTRGAGRALELWRKLRDFVHGRTCCLMVGRSIRTLSCHSGLHVVLYKKTAVWSLHRRNLRYVMCGTQSDPVSTRQRWWQLNTTDSAMSSYWLLSDLYMLDASMFIRDTEYQTFTNLQHTQVHSWITTSIFDAVRRFARRVVTCSSNCEKWRFINVGSCVSVGNAENYGSHKTRQHV